MKPRLLLLLLPILLFVVSCKKDKETTIDVSTQWQFDPSGAPIQTFSDNQWQNGSFTAAEMALFQSLDTVNLANTNKPNASVMLMLYPNPFATVQRLYFISAGFGGNTIFKYVFVDNRMKPQQKGCFSITGPSQGVLFQNSLAPGKYRLYYTLSAQGAEHYYKAWGNVQVIQ